MSVDFLWGLLIGSWLVIWVVYRPGRPPKEE